MTLYPFVKITIKYDVVVFCLLASSSHTGKELPLRAYAQSLDKTDLSTRSLKVVSS